jgi:putative membrane protein
MNQSMAKVLYVAGVTTFCTFLGCWAVLAHQENTPTKQGAQTQQSARRGSAAFTDEKFVRDAAQGGIAEVKLGQLAEEKGQNPEVKKFGKRMVEDHSKANEELKQVSTQEGINLPSDMGRKEAATYERLSKLSGPEFDKAYAQEMVKDHIKDVNEFKRATAAAQKPAVKEFAQKTLPTLESHLQEAKQMQAQVSREGGSKGKASGSSSRR